MEKMPDRRGKTVKTTGIIRTSKADGPPRTQLSSKNIVCRPPHHPMLNCGVARFIVPSLIELGDFPMRFLADACTVGGHCR